MFDYIAFRGDLGSFWVSTDSACNRFLGGTIIVFLYFFVVGCIPMNENADTDKEVIGLIPRNDALLHAVSDSLSDSMLSWAEHLHPLIVTLLNITVAGLTIRFGAITASRDAKPFLLFVRLLANAFSAALPRGPMMRSM